MSYVLKNNATEIIFVRVGVVAKGMGLGEVEVTATWL